MIRQSKIDPMRVAAGLDRLNEMPKHLDGIELIVLFGSLANGQRHALSDVDIAVRVDGLDDALRSKIRAYATEALGTDELDLVFLNDDLPYRLKYNVARSGRPLYERRQDDFLKFKVLATAMWFDYKPFADAQWKSFRGRVEKVGFGK